LFELELELEFRTGTKKGADDKNRTAKCVDVLIFCFNVNLTSLDENRNVEKP